MFQLRPVFESLADNTAAADAAIQAALSIADAPSGFAVMGLGRLGAREFDVLSDADVLFVCDERCDRREAASGGGAHDGSADRLHPRWHRFSGGRPPASPWPGGRVDRYAQRSWRAYFQDEAKPWEALTYLKLRHVAGDTELGCRALQAVQQGTAGLATRPGFDAELRDVRTRLERSEATSNFKTGPGGTYDIDYLAGALQVRHQLWLAGNLRDRLYLLRDHNLLEAEQARHLAESAFFLRTLEHLVRLVTGRARKWLPVAEHPRRAVQKLLWRVLEADDSFDPEMRLAEVMQQTRQVYLGNQWS